MNPPDPDTGVGVGVGAKTGVGTEDDRERFGPDAAPFHLVPFFRLCLFVTRDLHESLFRRIIQHPEIPRNTTWKRLRNAYWQAASALTGRGEATRPKGEGRGPDTLRDLPVLVQWLSVAIDAMQQEIETTDWGREMFPAPGPGDLGGRELRRLLRQL